MNAIICFIVAAALAAGQTTINGDRTMLGRWDAGEATSTRPVKSGVLAGRPAACLPGDLYFVTDAAAGQNMHFCTAVDVWSPMQVGGGGGMAAVEDPTVVWIREEFTGTSTTSGSIGALGWQLGGGGQPWLFRRRCGRILGSIVYQPIPPWGTMPSSTCHRRLLS